MLVLNPVWALASLGIMGLVYTRLQRTDLETRWGDVHSGVAFERAKQSLLYLQDEHFHPKNWRPAVLAFVGNPAHPHVVVTDRFHKALKAESTQSALVFLGFLPPAKDEEAQFMERTNTLIEDLPNVILVHSTGAVALDA
ncbi:MAG: hypothetical protein JJU29_03115 [Verrucomicrobia bacterium]|nr:hypothetical protein [Verrucomicrobiota bacterium]MCH8511164.1 hypothetical protein [Kiritimatiellia bacterium]